MTKFDRTERSHDKPRLVGPDRLRGLKPDAADRAPTPDAKRPFRQPRRKLSAALRARIARDVASATSGETSSQAGAQIAQTALSLYRAGQRELRTSSPIALSHLLRWAIGTATAQHLALEASDIGPATDRGRSLLELSLRLEGRAERASIAAATFAGMLGGNKPAGGSTPPPWLEGDDGEDDA